MARQTAAAGEAKRRVMTVLRIAIVGCGKIARDQHVAGDCGTDGVVLAAVADPNASLPDVPHFATLEKLLRDGPPIDAVASARRHRCGVRRRRLRWKPASMCCWKSRRARVSVNSIR